MRKDEKQKDFETLCMALREAYINYKINDLMHKELKSSDERYARFKEYWLYILRSTQFFYLSRLAAVFAKPEEKSVTIYNFLDYEFDEFKESLDALKRLRNKYLAHLDVQKTRELNSFLKKFEKELQREKFGEIFTKLIEKIAELWDKYGDKEKVPDIKSNIEAAALVAEEKFRSLYLFLSASNSGQK